MITTAALIMSGVALAISLPNLVWSVVQLFRAARPLKRRSFCNPDHVFRVPLDHGSHFGREPREIIVPKGWRPKTDERTDCAPPNQGSGGKKP